MKPTLRRFQQLQMAALMVVFGVVSCAPATVQPAPTPTSGTDYCVDEETGARLSYEEALAIAGKSVCVEEGQLEETHFCNPNSGTWWIDLAADKPGCAPACVVDVVDRSAEINWRCTGAIPPTEQTAESGEARITDPDVSPGDLAELVQGNSEFAFDLHRAIRDDDGNLVYSPFSISIALAITYAGARARTAEQMADTLQFTLPQPRLHPAFNSLDLVLAQRAQAVRRDDADPFRLHVVNALWGQRDYSFLESFLDLLAQNYGAGMRLLDFVSAPEAARVTINDWVSDQTEGRIEDLLSQGTIDELTRLVLTNAIYFDASWLHPFMEERTADGVFHLADGGEVTVPMMSQSESFGYVVGDGFQAIELPYVGEEVAMLIILPDEGELEMVQAELDAAWVGDIVDSIAYNPVALTMPRFQFETELNLSDTLASMGMPDAFGPTADFSGMTAGRELFISDVVHKAFVSVDEAGTEAAAATAVVMGRLGMPSEPIQVTVDRPFMFLIRDLPTGTILFMGRVLDPASY